MPSFETSMSSLDVSLIEVPQLPGINRLQEKLRPQINLSLCFEWNAISTSVPAAGDNLAELKDNAERQSSSHSSNSMDAMNPVGAKVSSSNGNNNEEHGVISVGLNSAYNSRNGRFDKNTGTAKMRMTLTNGPIIGVDIGISDDENGSDKDEKKMEGIRGFSSAIAAFSFAWSGVLIPYWIFCCSDISLSIPGARMDVLLAVGIALVAGTGMLTGLAANFKEGKSPVSRGFLVVQILQLLLLFCLSAASIIPLRICRSSSNWVVWTLASAVFCIIVLPWIVVFEHTEVVIKCIKSMFKKVLQWLRNLSLPECIKAKFEKVLRKQTDLSPPIERV